jgi:hypothetical protein
MRPRRADFSLLGFFSNLLDHNSELSFWRGSVADRGFLNGGIALRWPKNKKVGRLGEML